MDLIERRDNLLKPYKVVPIKEKIVEYKKREMEKIPFSQRVLRVISNSHCKNILDKEEVKGNVVRLSSLHRNIWTSGSGHYLKPKDSHLEKSLIEEYSDTHDQLLRIKKILEEYAYGSFYKKYVVPVYDDIKSDISNPTIVKPYNDIKDININLYNSNYISGVVPDYYLLVTLPALETSPYSGCYCRENIIQIPKTLYLLHILESENFNMFDILTEEDIQDQLELFNFISIGQCSDNIEILLRYGVITKEAYNFLNITSKILNKRR